MTIMQADSGHHRDPFPSTVPEHTAALRESLQDYAVITLDPAGKILQWSAGAQRIFGYEQSDVVGRSFALLFTPEDQAANQLAEELTNATRSGVSESDRWHMRKDGARIWVAGLVRASRDESGELTGFSKIAREVTTRKLADLRREALLLHEQAARVEAERRWKHLEEISENIPAFIGLVRLPGQVYVFANRIFREAVANRKLIGRTFREAHPNLAPELFDIFDAVTATGRAYTATGRSVLLPRAGGDSERYFDFVFQPMRSEAGQYEAILIFAAEVTDRVRARQASDQLTAELEAEGRRLKAEIAERKRAEDLARQRAATVQEQAALLDLARDAILSLTLDGAIEFWNRGAEVMYGWSREEALGRSVHELLRTRFPRPVEEVRNSLLANGQWAGELKHVCRGGPVVDVSSRWVLRRRGDKPSGWLEINRDVTERKRIESHLRDKHKLESLGVLAGGIAHDFNNLLTGIIGNTSLALEMAQPPSPIGDLLANALRAGEEAAFLTKQILAYAGKGQFVIQEVDLSAAVRDAVPLIAGSIPENVRVDLALAAGLPSVQADVAQLHQVAMNLILNAAEAIGEQSGNIFVRTAVQDIHAGAAAPACDIGRPAPSRYAVLEVRDTGAGIDPSLRPKIFDPFFSTRFTGRGLGLAAVSGIVRALNGAVQVDSTPGQGATFRVLFPSGEVPDAAGPQDARQRA
jgi:PAS domain S-box-containing protein